MLASIISLYLILGLFFVLLGKPSKLIDNELEPCNFGRMSDNKKKKLKTILALVSIIIWPSLLFATSAPWSNWRRSAESKNIELLSAEKKRLAVLEGENRRLAEIEKQAELTEIKRQAALEEERNRLAEIEKQAELTEIKRQAALEEERNRLAEIEKENKRQDRLKKQRERRAKLAEIKRQAALEEEKNRLAEIENQRLAVLEEEFNRLIKNTVEEGKQEAINRTNGWVAPQPTDFYQNNFNPYKSNSTQEIQTILQNRKIKYLVHFTKISNLQSILNNGFISRDKIDDGFYVSFINDPLRLDNHRDTISTSVSFPNYKMFYKYRNMSYDNWVVLLLDANLLLSKKAYFCKRNAADRRIRWQNVNELMQAKAFSGMFDELEDHQSRAEQNLQDYDPTDPQAEILVVGEIETSYIRHVFFEKHNSDEFMRFRIAYPHLSTIFPSENESENLFSSRPYARKFKMPEPYFY